MIVKKGDFLRTLAILSLVCAALDFLYAAISPSLGKTSLLYIAVIVFSVAVVFGTKEWIERLFPALLVVDMVVHSFLYGPLGIDGARVFRVIFGGLYLAVAAIYWRQSLDQPNVTQADNDAPR